MSNQTPKKHRWLIDMDGVMRRHHKRATDSQMILATARTFADQFPDEEFRIYRLLTRREHHLVATISKGSVKLVSGVKFDDHGAIEYARKQEPWKSLIAS